MARYITIAGEVNIELSENSLGIKMYWILKMIYRGLLTKN